MRPKSRVFASEIIEEIYWRHKINDVWRKLHYKLLSVGNYLKVSNVLVIKVSRSDYPTLLRTEESMMVSRSCNVPRYSVSLSSSELSRAHADWRRCQQKRCEKETKEMKAIYFISRQIREYKKWIPRVAQVLAKYRRFVSSMPENLIAGILGLGGSFFFPYKYKYIFIVSII